MDYRFAESRLRKRVAVMVSREDHCLSDLLWRWRNGHLGGEIVAVISNHEDRAARLSRSGCPSTTCRRPRDHEAAERRALELIEDVELLVLARYMQILSPGFLSGLGARRSTSTTASSPPSSAPIPTPAPTSAA